jgi:HTH-type transcriptional regulator/antitoxin HigA
MYSKNAVAIPPGATIREQLENRGMKQKEFALRMGLSEKHISRLINGQVELTQDVALRLESVLGVPASFWNNLEAIYREKLARIIAEMNWNEVASCSAFPIQRWLLVWLATQNPEEQGHNLRRFFEVAKLDYLIDENSVLLTEKPAQMKQVLQPCSLGTESKNRSKKV